MARRRMQSLTERIPEKIADIIAGAERYHKRFKDMPTFGGPSLHFHHRALEPGPLENRVEPIYAVLASWGMQRMGRGGPKMADFVAFRHAILSSRTELERLSAVTFESVGRDQTDLLVDLAAGLRVMKTGTWLVANSKVLAHLLPNLVAPIDREYTLRYLTGGRGSYVAADDEEELFRTITTQFYWPIARDPNFKATARHWVSEDLSSWDTSLLKIIDNLVIGARNDGPAAS